MPADRNFNPDELVPSLTALNTDSAPPGIAACLQSFVDIEVVEDYHGR